MWINCLLAGALLLSPSVVAGEPALQIPTLEQLLRYENTLINRSGGKEELPRSEKKFGSDPFKILYLPANGQYLILLRNRSELLLADGSLNVLDQQPTPRSPTGWALANERFLFVGGELSSEIYLYEIGSSTLRLRHKLRFQNVVSVRDLVYVPSSRSLFLLDDFDRRLHQLSLALDWTRQEPLSYHQRSFPLGAGAIQIRNVDGHLLINLLLEHMLLIVPLRDGGPDFSLASRITHDGPIWGFDTFPWKDELVIAAGGIENRPLDRSGGEFGYIDSFLFLYRVPRDRKDGFYRWQSEYRGRPNRFMEKNLSEIDVVTPKALRFASPSGQSVDLWISAFGSPKTVRFKVGREQLRLTGSFSTPPGTTDFVLVEKDRNPKKAAADPTLVLTNSLFDRIYRMESRSRKTAQGILSHSSRLSKESRIGEMLFFTILMGPLNHSEGRLSRFTCEACHFEGAIDGRVHYTGREHVFATTKPLRGLASNVPLFSRAGDNSLSSMVLAEFCVANQGRKDSFSIEVSKYPWLKKIGGLPKILSPTVLRKALLSFFVDFDHRPNPLRAQGRKLSTNALEGLAVFRERCEHCHQAVLSTRRGDSLPWEKWREWLEIEGKDLVWGAPFYTKTGIEPYVHSAGARVPSLRRVYQKYPYFTNGSSRALRDLLSRLRYKGATVWHYYEASSAEAEGVKSLTAEEISGLEELLRYF